jgi:DEAD/DEAH box helicase domain-containing protein
VNLTLGFPDPDSDDTLKLTRRADLEKSIARLTAWMQEPDSPIRAIRRIPAREADSVEIPETVPEKLREVLVQRGIERLFVHQAESFEALNQGKNVVVVTPTASGKTLCYNLPVLCRLMEDPDARALYIFPTKALAEEDRKSVV